MKNLILIVFAITFSFISSCKKNEDSIAVEINSSTCYKGVILARDCPSFAFIQVKNKNIGSTWRFNDKIYENVIGISNLPESIKLDTIYFTVNLDEKFEDCIIQKPCQSVIYYEEYPSKIYCASSISTNNCLDNEN